VILSELDFERNSKLLKYGITLRQQIRATIRVVLELIALTRPTAHISTAGSHSANATLSRIYGERIHGHVPGQSSRIRRRARICSGESLSTQGIMSHDRSNDAPANFANYVLVLQPVETLVQFYVVEVVVVSLGEE
jgi:hypothetical protein